MMDELLLPFQYDYMNKAIFAATFIGAVCAMLSSYLMLKGWSLIGDALSHSIVPGVAAAYMIGAPYVFGAFFSGLLASASMGFIKAKTKLREDAIIGLIFTSFFALGLFMVSLSPTSVNVKNIVLGNILGVSDEDIFQMVLIAGISFFILIFTWKDLMVTFFDESHAKTIGINTKFLTILFFTLLSACTIAALQTVGALLVIGLIVTPGATAYLLCDRFGQLMIVSTLIGSITCFFGAYISFFLDGATGGIIILLQTIVFIIAFIFAPKYGLVAAKRKIKQASELLRKTREGAV
ncbi:MAG: metal ABC transporter permease [Rhizobiales bacterium]|nr:metal ABC transporter permease [Hyphomicrobiales bacterium]NRB15362.1 metal ABC transporter permease [Hyphomicrobiales bacterium]